MNWKTPAILLVAMTTLIGNTAVAEITVLCSNDKLVIFYESDFGDERKADFLPDVHNIVERLVHGAYEKPYKRPLQGGITLERFSGKTGALSHFEAKWEYPRFFDREETRDLSCEEWVERIQAALAPRTEVEPVANPIIGGIVAMLIKGWFMHLGQRFGSGRH